MKETIFYEKKEAVHYAYHWNLDKLRSDYQLFGNEVTIINLEINETVKLINQDPMEVALFALGFGSMGHDTFRNSYVKLKLLSDEIKGRTV